MPKPEKEKKLTGIVVEVFNHDPLHLVVVVRSRSFPKKYFFFYTKAAPDITLGDKCLLNFPAEEFHIIQDTIGRQFRKFPLDLCPWPGTLLLETMNDRLDI